MRALRVTARDACRLIRRRTLAQPPHALVHDELGGPEITIRLASGRQSLP